MTTPALLVEVNFDGGMFDIGSGAFFDVTEYVKSLSIRRGRQHELGRDEAGVMTIVFDNRERRFDPWGYIHEELTSAQVLRRIRVKATNEAVLYPMFDGMTENLGQEWIGRPIQNAGGSGEAVYECVDLFRAMTLLPMGNTYREEILLDAPLGYYPCDEPGGRWYRDLGTAALDLESYVTTGNPSFGQPGPLIGGKTSVSGSDAGLSLGDPSAYAGTAFAGDFTLEAWVYVSSAASIHNIVSLADSGTSVYYQWDLDSAEKPRLVMSGDGLDYTLTAAAALANATWHHVVVTRKGRTVRMYHAGVLTDTFTAGASSGSFVAPLFLRVAGPPAAGREAHIAIWRRALPPERIAAHFARKFDTFTEAPTGTQIGRILDAVGWTSGGERSLDVGLSTIAEHVPGDVNALDHALALAEDTELGRFYVAADGKATFAGRDAPWQQPVSSQVWTDGFDPRSVSPQTLVWWADASRVQLAPDQAVQTWQDLTGNLNEVANAVGTEQPLLRYGTTPSGLAALDFDTTDDSLTATDPAILDFGTGGMSLALVFRLVSGGATLEQLVKKKSTTAAGTAGWGLFRNTAGALAFYISDAVTQVISTTTNDFDDNLWHIAVIRVNRAGSVTIYVDGVSEATDSVTAVTGSISNTVDLIVGDSAGGADMELAELAIWDTGAIGAADRDALTTHWSQKYGIDVAGVPSFPVVTVYERLGLRYDDADYYNEADVENASGLHAVASDDSAIGLDGRRKLARSTLIANDNETVAMAAGLLAKYHRPDYRFESVVIRGGGSAARLTAMLDTALGDRVTVRRHPPAVGGRVIESDCLVESIAWTIQAPARWDVVLGLSPVEPGLLGISDPQQFWLLGNATYGTLNQLVTILGY